MDYSLDTCKYLDNILSKLNKVNNKYNEEYQFTIISRGKKKTVNNGYLSMAENNLLNNRLDKLNKIRKKNKKKTNIEVDETTNILTDAVMTLNMGTNNKRWKDLTIEEKIGKFNDYFDVSKYKEYKVISSKIKDLIQKKKIDYRKYIVYDKINQRIDELPIIFYNDKTKEYELLTDIEKKVCSKRCHKKKISKIIQIK
jgi:hypothetical protein